MIKKNPGPSRDLTESNPQARQDRGKVRLGICSHAPQGLPASQGGQQIVTYDGKQTAGGMKKRLVLGGESCPFLCFYSFIHLFAVHSSVY